MNLTKKEKEQAIIDVWRKLASAMLVDGPNVDDAFDEIKRIVNGETYKGTPIPNIAIKDELNNPVYYQNVRIRYDDFLSDLLKVPMVMINMEDGSTLSIKSSDVNSVFDERRAKQC